MTSVLDQMTADVTAVKQAAALTPVGTEKGAPLPPNRIPDVPEVFLTQEAVLDIAKDLRVQAATLIAVAEGLERQATGEVVAPPPDKEAVVAAVKEAEAAADDRAAEFAASYAAQQQAAQAAVYGDAPAEPERVAAASGSPASNWVCPEHGDKGLRDLTSKRGRAYRACTICSKFEK
jgi:hypothetical protein